MVGEIVFLRPLSKKQIYVLFLNIKHWLRGNTFIYIKLKSLNRETLEILVGLLLGDGHIGKSGNLHFITLEQSSKHKDYVINLHNLLKHLGLDLYDIKYYSRLDSRYGTTTKSIYFKTHNSHLFFILGVLFLGNGTKKIISSSIQDWLTPVSLAHWICGDGQLVKGGGITLCTDSYTLEEVKLLIKALTSNFDVICSIHKKKGKNGTIYYRIYIFKDSFDKIKPLLVKHIHKSFLYKLHM